MEEIKDSGGQAPRHTLANLKFTPPTLEDVEAYCKERGNAVDAQRFVDFYASKGWMVGKNKMKDWQAAVRTWENKNGGSPPGPHYAFTGNGNSSYMPSNLAELAGW